MGSSRVAGREREGETQTVYKWSNFRLANIHIYMNTYDYITMHICTYIYICICMFIHIYVYVYMRNRNRERKAKGGALPSEEGKPYMGFKTLALKTRRESGIECLSGAILARQRELIHID